MTYVFDLDSVLCETTYLDYENSKAIYDHIEILNRLYDQGHTIIIDSGRYSGEFHELKCKEREKKLTAIRIQTKRQLDSWGVKYHELRIGYRIPADVYVCDYSVSAKDFFN